MVDARQPKPSKVDRTGSAADAEGEHVREAQTQMKNTRTQEKFTFQEGISFQQPCDPRLSLSSSAPCSATSIDSACGNLTKVLCFCNNMPKQTLWMGFMQA